MPHKGKKHWQWIAETDVSLTRPKPSSKKSRKPAVPGSPVEACLVISRILTDDVNLLAEWFLITHVTEVDKVTIALWYYGYW